MKKYAVQLTELDEWKDLAQHYSYLKNQRVKNNNLILLLQQKALAVEVFCNNSNSTTQELLLALFNKSYLNNEKERLFSSTADNHLRYRQLLQEPNSHNESEPILTNFTKMTKMVNAIRARQWCGGTGKPIDNVVFIAGDGFDVSLRMLTYSLDSFNSSKINFRFLVNSDISQINETLKNLNPESTLFILSANCLDACEIQNYLRHTQDWLKGIPAINRHYIAITQINQQLPQSFPLSEDNILKMVRLCSSRLLAWSPMSLPFAISVGMEQYIQFIRGGYAMDEHFLHMPVHDNIPVQLALFDIWHISVCKLYTRAVIPYAQSLNLLLEYLAKIYKPKSSIKVDRQGRDLDYQVGSTIGGCVGSMHDNVVKQFISSCCQNVPCDFIFVKQQSDDNVKNEHINKYARKRSYNKIELEELTPYFLGSLMVLYEHRLFSQSILWNINPII